MPVPKLLVTAALMAVQVGLQMTQRIKGPRLDELSVSVADYGTPIPRFWGTRRFECPVIWAEDLREEKTTSKTKGGKYEEYKYYGTFAITIADHEIDAVTRIWMDRRLVYDVTKEGPISVASLFRPANSTGPIKLSSGKNMRVYLGTESQEVDPRYQAWCEDRYGADSAPAYRGVSYIVFEDIPLEAFGNRIPQVTVEAVSVKADAFLVETKTTARTSDSTFAFSPSGEWLAYWDNTGTDIEWWDVASRTKIGTSPGAGTATSSASSVALAGDGTAYFVGLNLSDSFDPYFYSCAPMGTPTGVETTGGSSFVSVTRVLEDGTDRYVYTAYDTATGYLSSASHIGHAQSARDFCIDADGARWGLFHPTGTSDQFTIENLATGDSHTFTGTSRSGPTGGRFCYVAEYGHFFVRTDGNFYIIDPSSWTITNSGAAGFATFSSVNQQANPHQTTFWTLAGGYKEWSLEDGSLIRTLAKADWLDVSDGAAAFDPLNHAVWARQTAGSDVYIRYLDRVTNEGVKLQTVVDDVCGWCGISAEAP